MNILKQKWFISVVLSYCLAILGSGYISFLTFSYCKNTFEEMRVKDKSNPNNNASNVYKKEIIKQDEIDLTIIHSFKLITDCKLEHFDDKDHFDCSAVKKQEETQDNNNDVYDKIGGKPLIKAIEILLMAGLTIQIFLTVYTLFLRKISTFDKYVFHLSDWAINTPPILGVLANLVSFSLLLTQVGDIQKMFSGYFFQAVITTLIGGVFYIINLALKVIIHPRIETVV